MKISTVLNLFLAVIIGFLGMVSVAEACSSDEWCCKRDFSAPGNPCIKCCSKNQSSDASGPVAQESKNMMNTANAEPCEKLQQSSNTPLLLSKVEGIDPVENFADESIQHGTWHPCAEDPDACGSGHVCCAGHCIYGSTCGGN